ncbi:MAG: hypothetical protein HY877_05440 [Deltaproteobacteria bacterium]|nr:hypothetical protein [Deltaproteobacteria bacterium]
MFTRLEREENKVQGRERVRKIFEDIAFADFNFINVLPLIYDEKKKRCNILVFDYKKAQQEIVKITRQDAEHGRKHPVYRFYDAGGSYVCEVRYGKADANALQRGLWTHTKNGLKYFDSVTNGWIDYTHNRILVELFSHALVSSEEGHVLALEKIKEAIGRLKLKSGLQQ